MKIATIAGYTGKKKRMAGQRVKEGGSTSRRSTSFYYVL